MRKKIKIPLYHTWLVIEQGDDFNEMANRNGFDEGDWGDFDAAVGMCGNSVVMMFRMNTTAGVIAHEAVHAVNYIFKRAGVKLDLNNDEPQAYLTGYLVGKLYEVLDVKSIAKREKVEIKIKPKTERLPDGAPKSGPAPEWQK